VQYTSMSNGYRAALSDAVDQTNVFTGGTLYSRRPNVRLTFQAFLQLDSPVVTIENITEGVRLSWSAIIGAAKYIVYGSIEPETGYSQIAEVTGNQYTDISAMPFRFYYVTAADGAAVRNNLSK
jgi:hypothetical protein